MKERLMIEPNGKYYDYRLDNTLNELQIMHMNGEIDLHEPIEAYYAKWKHDNKGNNHQPIEETRTRKDLPSIAQQWKTDYNKRRNNNG